MTARPAPRAAVAASTLVLLALPAWAMGDALGSFALKMDDFVYVAESRTWPATVENLLAPHNAHVVPLFRLLTFGLVAASGGLAGLPISLPIASYTALAAAMLAVGHLVARETRSASRGLAAMAVLGLSTVIEPAVVWYSAGQALWSGLAVVLMLIALGAWRDTGRPVWLALGAVLALAAAAIWSGGFVAGPAGAAYLGAVDRRRCRLAAIVPMAASLLYAVPALTIARAEIAAVQDPNHRRVGPAERLARGALHTAQAIPETLVLANLGIDAETTPIQGLALSAALAGAWAWSRGGVRPSPLEAAGAAMAIVGFGLAYTFRATYGFASLRTLGWYQTIPQLGAVLFASGWAAGLRAGTELENRRATPRSLIAVAGLAAVLIVVHGPRALRLFLDDLPPPSGSERQRFPVPSLQRSRGRYLAGERLARQRRFLARMDLAGGLAAGAGFSQEGVRRALGPRVGPGMPDKLPGFDAASLLPVPRSAAGATGRDDPARIGAILDAAMAIEPDPRPPWLATDDPWPPAPP